MALMENKASVCVWEGWGGDRVCLCSLEYNPLARFPLLSIGLGLGVPFAREAACKRGGGSSKNPA
jgi:hypothetical protein